MTATWINPNDEFVLRSERTARQQRDAEGQSWANLLRWANADRRNRVAERPSNALSLSAAARDAGIVPHASSQSDPKPIDVACTVAQRRNREAAALLQYEYRHPVFSYYHVTAWEIARRPAHI